MIKDYFHLKQRGKNLSKTLAFFLLFFEMKGNLTLKKFFLIFIQLESYFPFIAITKYWLYSPCCTVHP